jgi:hypothetical protein
MTKYCGKCQKEKSKTLFSASSKNPDKLHAWCRACQREYYDGGLSKSDLPEGHETRHLQKFLVGRLGRG